MADTVAVNPDHPESYVVKKGDTLCRSLGAGRISGKLTHRLKIPI
jgi:hypothetical protein